MLSNTCTCGRPVGRSSVTVAAGILGGVMLLARRSIVRELRLSERRTIRREEDRELFAFARRLGPRG